MEYLFGGFAHWFGDPDVLRWGIVVVSGLIFFALFWGFLALLDSISNPVRKRIRAWRPAVAERSRVPFSSRWLGALRPIFFPQSVAELTRVRQDLTVAGFRTPNAVPAFYGAKATLGLGLPLLTLLGAVWVPGLTALHVLAMALAASAMGLAAPNTFVRRAAQRRKQRLARALPDALDLLVVCTEAGYGLKPALQRVADEIHLLHPELAEELSQANAELRAGVEREEAFHNLVERNQLEELRGLVTLLIQSMRFGTSIADSLRVYAEEFRQKRMQRAEEKAATIQTRMVFPLVLCIFPAFFVVTVGPPILGVLKLFARM